MTAETANFDSWIGKTESLREILTINPMIGMAATLERSDLRLGNGSILPPLWHWLYFLAPAPRSTLAEDGHPNRGDFLPPIDLPRRMWGGSRFQFNFSLRVNEVVERKSEILSIKFKEGRSGQLAFVTVRHTLISEQGEALNEEHDIVYRDNPGADASKPQPLAAPAQFDYSKNVTPDPVLLFRYSALTFNGHRIHYDREYVTKVEGYPGLIVHGPLLATLLVELLREKLPKYSIDAFEFKAVHPIFDLNDFMVCGLNPDTDGKVELWIQNHEGSLCMKASAIVSNGIPKSKSA
jgi:3-methylfumaryl-CoA hydratase